MSGLAKIGGLFGGVKEALRSKGKDRAASTSEQSIQTTPKAVMSGMAEPQNLSTSLDADRIQAALRAAERGDTWQLFAIYRDMVVGYSHLQSEWGKRKMVVIGQPHALIPKDKHNQDDVLAAKVIQQMIDNCENWMDGLNHILDATLYPVCVSEKIFRPVSEFESLEHPCRYMLRRINPVNYSLLCFKAPYSPYFATNYNPDDWEPDLRLYKVNDFNGTPNYSVTEAYIPNRDVHIVHRGHMLSTSIRDNFGGQMRAVLFWWLLATKDRDWFGTYMQKYGSPFIVGKADAQQKDTVNALREAFALATQIGGLVIDKRAQVELIQAASADGATAHKTLINICNEEVSKIVVGQVLSSTPKNTGLGSGMASLHGEVRHDIALWDKLRLNETLKRQLFAPFLKLNGYRGRAPDILWGGQKEDDAQSLADSVSKFSSAGLEPDDSGVEVLSQRVGYNLRRKPQPEKVDATQGKASEDSDENSDAKAEPHKSEE